MTEPARPPRPVTYASADDARGYVAAVLGAAPAAPDGPAYVAIPPAVVMSERWPILRPVLAGLLPGVPLTEWADLDAETRAGLGSRATRTAYLAATCRALVVVALRRPDMRREVTPGVLAEVAAFTAQARPVLAFTGRRLVAWPDCRTRPPRDDGPRHRVRQAAAMLDVPAAPDRPLPTLAASLRVLGVEDPAAIERASAGGPGGGPSGVPGGPSAMPGPDDRAPSPRPSARRLAPPRAKFRPPPAVSFAAGAPARPRWHGAGTGHGAR
jgi:hypothetical protein